MFLLLVCSTCCLCRQPNPIPYLDQNFILGTIFQCPSYWKLHRRVACHRTAHINSIYKNLGDILALLDGDHTFPALQLLRDGNHLPIPTVPWRIVDVVNTMLVFCNHFIGPFEEFLVILNFRNSQMYKTRNRNSPRKFYRWEGGCGLVKLPGSVQIDRGSAISGGTECKERKTNDP
jgi:hypothetical protein